MRNKRDGRHEDIVELTFFALLTRMELLLFLKCKDALQMIYRLH